MLLNILIAVLIMGTWIWVVYNLYGYLDGGFSKTEKRDSARRLLLTPVWPAYVLAKSPKAILSLVESAQLSKPANAQESREG